MGYYIGDQLNRSEDNLLFTLLFKREGILDTDDSIIKYSLDLLIKSLKGNNALTEDERIFLDEIANSDKHNHPTDKLKKYQTIGYRKQATKNANSLPGKSQIRISS